MIVSNHGGRQIDGGIAALDALPRVVKAVGQTARPSCSIAGSAAGPTCSRPSRSGPGACLLGRPYCLGLAVGGEQGVRDVLSNLIADIDLTLGLAGCVSFAEVTRDRLVEIPCPDAHSEAD